MASVIKDLGPCWVIWDPNGVNATFKKTFGGVKFTYEELRAPIKRDQAGLTDVDEVSTGVINPELECPFTQEENTKLVNLFGRVAGAASYLKVSNPVGEAMLASAKLVIVKPIVDGVVSTTASEWLYIYRAVPRITMEVAWDNSSQRTTKTMFKGFPDDISGRQDVMWSYGTLP